MDPTIVGLSALIGLVAGGLGGAGGVAMWAANRRRDLTGRLTEMSFAHDVVHQRVADLDARVSAREAELAEAQARLKLTARDGASRSGELQAELSRLRDDASRLDERCRTLEQKAATAEQARDATKRELASASAQATRVRNALAALGVVLPDQAWSPTDPERRGASRECLQSLLVDTGSSAVALVDREGLATFAVGPDEIIERLSVAGAMFGALEATLGALLCAPVDELRIVTLRGATHLLAVPGSRWLLAIENQGASPRHAATRARLELFGKPEPARPIVEIPAYVHETSRAPDPEVERMLAAWSRRWGVEVTALLDAAGQVIGSTSDNVTGPMLGLRRALGPTLARFARDGWALDAIELQARSEGLGVAVRPIDGDLESPVLMACSRILPDTGALDELAATARWHLAPPIPTAAVFTVGSWQ